MNLVHMSWVSLKPNEDEREEPELFVEYYNRIKNKIEFKDFPKEVLEQWIHSLYKHYETNKNYAWLNYEYIGFELLEWEYPQLEKLYVIEGFREHVELRASYSELSKFCCEDKDLDFWKANGTWRVPPIILDTNSITNEVPKWSEISNEFQLVEGHSRLGYLKSIKRINELGNIKIAKKHKVYLMSLRKNHNGSSHEMIQNKT